MNDRASAAAETWSEEPPSQFILISNDISFNYGAKLTRNTLPARDTARDERNKDNSGITEASLRPRGSESVNTNCATRTR